jgi:hypothetical protein
MVVGMLNHIVSAPAGSGAARPTPGSDGSRAYAINPNVWLNWRPKRGPREHVLSVAELAECTCPDLCDRDHANE